MYSGVDVKYLDPKSKLFGFIRAAIILLLLLQIVHRCVVKKSSSVWLNSS